MSLNIFGEALTLTPGGANRYIYTGGYNGNSESVASVVTGNSEVTKSGIRRTLLGCSVPWLKLNEADTPAVEGSWGNVSGHVVIAHPVGNVLTNCDHPSSAASEYTAIDACIMQVVTTLMMLMHPKSAGDVFTAPDIYITDPIVRASLGMQPIDPDGEYGVDTP